jgi:restriction endonuclease S subunit
VKGKRFTPKDKRRYKYIELANIGKHGEITGCTMEEGQDLPTRARRRVSTGDVIVSSIEGSLSSIALVEEAYHHALCSTGFHVIKSEILNSETLFVLMKSLVGQLQLEKGCSGTILTAINKDDFSRLVLPKIREKKQTQIKALITESVNLRKESKRLLEVAKRTVEIAIEKDEKSALTWLDAQIE